jgi:hypothetical protein
MANRGYGVEEYKTKVVEWTDRWQVLFSRTPRTDGEPPLPQGSPHIVIDMKTGKVDFNAGD